MALRAITKRREPSCWERFLHAPYPTLAQFLYDRRQHLLVERKAETAVEITVVCVSDTHNSQPRLPPGDVLVHAGDLTQGGTAKELQAQLDWLDSQPHEHKFVIAGNHDVVLDNKKSAEFGHDPNDRQSLRWGSIVYLERSSRTITVRGRPLTVFGHPSTRKNGNWAFQHERDVNVFSHQLPDHVDILVTHSPPQYHLDVAGWGDKHLLRELWRVKPKLHVFGHIHAGYGRDVLLYDEFEWLYEGLHSGKLGLLALCKMLWLLFWMVVGVPFDQMAKRTVLINAAALGGLRDESRGSVQTVRI